MDTIIGTLTNIRFSKNGFLIGILSSGEAVKGNMSEPVIGQDYRLAGDWEDDPKWGRQFKFDRYGIEAPQDAEGVYRYLVRVCKWVGPVVGRSIVKTFGDDALDVLKTDPQQAADRSKGSPWTELRKSAGTSWRIRTGSPRRSNWKPCWGSTTFPSM